MSAPLGAFTFLASYQERDGDPLRPRPVEGDGTVFAVGGKYDLSRRTNLFLVYADIRGREVALAGHRREGQRGNRKTLMMGINHRF